jgi:hypothetical protein
MNRYLALVGLFALLISGTAAAARPAKSVSQSIKDGTTLSGSITWTATPAPSGGVSSIHFFVDGVDKWTETRSPYQFNGDPNGQLDTTTLSNGSHTFRVTAIWSRGATASDPVTVAVSNNAPSSGDTTPPTVSWTRPLGGQTVSGSLGLTNCEAAASDNVGIDHVDFKVDGALANTERQAPYTCEVDTTTFSQGQHVLSATAFDAAGNSKVAQITVTFQNASSPPPPPPSSSGTANLWVDPAGGFCTRQATAGVYADAQPCPSLSAAYQAAACGDTVIVRGGSYGGQTISHRAALDACTAQVSYSNAAGEKVIVNGALSFSAAMHVAVVADARANFLVTVGAKGQGTALIIGSSGSTRSTDITVKNINFDGGLNIESVNGAVIENNDFGPTYTTSSSNNESQFWWKTPGLPANTNVMFAYNFVHDATSDGVGHTSCLMVPWLINSTFRGNTFVRCDNEGILVKAGWTGSSPWLRNLTIEDNVFGAACSTCGVGPDAGMSINTNGAEGTVSNPYQGFVIRNNSYHDPIGFNNGNGTTFSNSFFTGNIVPQTKDARTGATCANGLTSAFNVFPGSGAMCGTNAVRISSYPYVNPTDTPSLDYHLAGASGADNAVPMSVPAGCAPKDIDGQARPMGAACDAGADER